MDGSLLEFDKHESIVSKLAALRRAGYSGKTLVHELLTDDWGPPPIAVHIQGHLVDGSVVDETIVYD